MQQFQTQCNSCKRHYVVTGEPGQTIHAVCPYCGAQGVVVTPMAVQKEKKKSKPGRPFYWKVTLVFLTVATVLFVGLLAAYFILKGISQ